MLYSELMDITYFGHASFKLRGKTGTVVTDPYSSSIGFRMPQASADIVTISHHHDDHDVAGSVKGTTRLKQPFIIDAPGEYELLQISVVGIGSFHNDQQGQQRGRNIIMIVTMDKVKIVHLGDLGHLLASQQLQEIGPVDVLLVPVGGGYTIGPKQAVEVVHAIEPAITVPMHYRTGKHSSAFDKLAGVEAFLKEMGQNGYEPKDKLMVTPGSLPEELEVVVLE